MAVMQASGRNPEGLLHKDDEVWLQNVLNMIPKSVYGDDSSHIGSNENSKKKGQNSAKKSSSKKMGRANKGQTKESDDVSDSRHASLKRKLHEKILEKRVARKADDESYMEARAAKKRKRDANSPSASREGKKIRVEKGHLKQNKRNATMIELGDSEQPETPKRKLDGEGDNGNAVSLETTRVAGFDSDKPARKVKRRKLRGSKLLELQKKLEEVNKRKELQQKETKTSGAADNTTERQTNNDSKKTTNDSRNLEMEKAMQRAQGIDVKDDAKKLRKSIRKEKRKSEKSREEWAKRTKTQEIEQKAKQERKARNLEERKAKRGSVAKSRAGLGKKR